VWFARFVTSVRLRSEAEVRAKAAIDTALQLDDTLADAHLRLAQYEAQIRWNWAAADREFMRAIELNPNQANTRSIYADHLAIVQRGDEALAQATRALELDPVSTQSQTFYARILMFTGRFEEAIARYRETLKASADQQVRPCQHPAGSGCRGEVRGSVGRRPALGRPRTRRRAGPRSPMR
jgi:Tfp pilus assembly protein PilF